MPDAHAISPLPRVSHCASTWTESLSLLETWGVCDAFHFVLAPLTLQSFLYFSDFPHQIVFRLSFLKLQHLVPSKS